MAEEEAARMAGYGGSGGHTGVVSDDIARALATKLATALELI